MTDLQTIEALIARDEQVTQQFFFESCRPLFLSIIRHVFSYEVDYDEFVNELYLHLMENDAHRLKQYQGRSTIYQWMKVVAIRYFIAKRDSMIDNESKNTLLDCAVQNETIDEEKRMTAKIDIEHLFSLMQNRRYAYVIRRLVLHEAEPKVVAHELQTNVDNLYNIKKRAIAALTEIALKEVEEYEKKSEDNISAEILAAFLDGNTSESECKVILGALSEDAELRELIHISGKVDAELGLTTRECELIPMTAMAATCNEDNYCSLECEKYVLSRLNIEFDEKRLLQMAIQNGWQKDEGTPLHNVGRHLESKGLVVTRQYKASIADIAKALDENEYVIVAVDGGELLGNRAKEMIEDVVIGPIPDHTIVVLSLDENNKTITIFDPNSSNAEDIYPIEQFKDAWNDSKNYLVTITSNSMKTYIPKPIDLSDVKLTEDLNDLREAIAENAHEIWAENRQAEGWTYGPQRDDKLKQTPDMVPYSQLPEGEKEYDREMAIKTIKLLKKLGYDLIKREETELYKILRQRILDSDEEFLCRRCGNVIYKHQIFCDKCGLELKINWE